MNPPAAADLSAEAKAYIAKVRELAEVPLNCPYSSAYNILRWLRAYSFDVDLAAAKLRRHLVVREIMNLDGIEHIAPSNIDERADHYSPISIAGKVRPGDNKVLLFDCSGKVDIQGLVNGVRATPFMLSRFRIMERILRRINREEQASGQMSGSVMVVDLEGLQFQASLIKIISGPYRIMWGTLLEQYPDIINKIVVVNCPKFMNLIWRACTPFISEEYRSKIVLTGDDWREELKKHVHPSCLPVYYGGTLIGPDNDPRCEHLIDYPPNELFPDNLPEIAEELETFFIPAGQEVVHTYNWKKGKLLEFFMHHDEEFTMVIMYSREREMNESDWVEVYAGCERPALTKLDTWTWQAPYTGYFHIKYGNEKAWFLGVSVNYRIYEIECDGSRTIAKAL
ncbi:hypothetical protein L596_006618 [Steinernema carpocapsae]|uniref:CRAL-TRIO domain-containing protein n=1 Tax=Steinernema carpocapsae TaxID=34508 RepID=A0A4U8V2P4_STECR|nr:hypothetical protein L596_006618 [Steinernema carpocapsae]